jgi:lipopolysaccharide export system ATP-binding protein
MGYLSQETSVFRRLSVEQNILAILEAIPTCRSLGRPLNRKERWERTDAVLDQFGLTRVRKNKAARLSGGEKRRLEIARCLVCEPLLILLDEPFTGIDPKTIADIQEIVRVLRAQGIGILLTDHNVREALKITDRSYLIKDGRVRTHGTPEQIIRDPIAIEEYLGHSFNDDRIGNTVRYPSPAPQTSPAGSWIVQHDNVRVLIERLKGQEGEDAARALVQIGRDALPDLLEALERRDVEMRRQAYMVILTILDGVATFDPYAPEAQRLQQIAHLREQLSRKAG